MNLQLWQHTESGHHVFRLASSDGSMLVGWLHSPVCQPACLSQAATPATSTATRTQVWLMITHTLCDAHSLAADYPADEARNKKRRRQVLDSSSLRPELVGSEVEVYWPDDATWWSAKLTKVRW